MKQLVLKAGLQEQIIIDSAGILDCHQGKLPDARMRAHAVRRGYQLDSKSRPVVSKDFFEFDYIIGMDHENISNLMLIRPAVYTGHVELFLSFSQKPENRDQTVVPDPYYGGENGFALVLNLVEDAAAGLLNHIVAELERGSQ